MHAMGVLQKPVLPPFKTICVSSNIPKSFPCLASKSPKALKTKVAESQKELESLNGEAAIQVSDIV
jgi:hypothetical protein